MGFGQNDGDDVKVKGVDSGGTDREIIAKADGSEYRLGTDAKISNANDDDPLSVRFSRHSVDLFDRLLVSELQLLWSFVHRYDDDIDLYFDKDTGTGTGTFTHNATTVAMELENSTGNGHLLDYRTYRYFEYNKGRQQTFIWTMNPRGTQTDVVKRFGCFDETNGLFFELNGSTPYIVSRSSTSGSAVDTKVAQSSWNYDKLDGTGESGITIDWSNFNLFYIDFAWLGTNAAEYGIFSNGRKIPVHRTNYSNSIATAYSQSGNLPFCFSIENTAALGAAPTMDVGCLSVFNGGLQSQIGEVFDVNTGENEVTVNTTPILISAFRMKSTQNRASLKPIDFSLLSPSGNSTIYYRVLQDVDIVGGVWTSVPNSIAEELTSYTSYSGGFVVQSGYIKAGGDEVLNREIVSDLYTGRFIDGTSQVLAIEARTVSSNSKLLFSGRFREFK